MCKNQNYDPGFFNDSMGWASRQKQKSAAIDEAINKALEKEKETEKSRESESLLQNPYPLAVRKKAASCGESLVVARIKEIRMQQAKRHATLIMEAEEEFQKRSLIAESVNDNAEEAENFGENEELNLSDLDDDSEFYDYLDSDFSAEDALFELTEAEKDLEAEEDLNLDSKSATGILRGINQAQLGNQIALTLNEPDSARAERESEDETFSESETEGADFSEIETSQVKVLATPDSAAPFGASEGINKDKVLEAKKSAKLAKDAAKLVKDTAAKEAEITAKVTATARANAEEAARVKGTAEADEKVKAYLAERMQECDKQAEDYAAKLRTKADNDYLSEAP